MAKRSTKHQSVSPVKFVLNGGLNYSSSPTGIADNELKTTTNFIYDPNTDYLMTRPGTTAQAILATGGDNLLTEGGDFLVTEGGDNLITASATSAAPLLTIYYYEKSATVTYLIGVADGKLYYLSGASLDTWTLIGTLSDTTTVPSFLTFNDKLLIADGGSEIMSWNGTTYTALTGSPAASALSMIKNRVVANAVDEPDSVYLSKANDETDWNTSTNAIGLKAGYGDNLAVNAFAVFGDDLIISKRGNAIKRIYRLNVADTETANWYVKDLSAYNCSQNAHSMVSAYNNVFFIDTNGFKSLKGVQQYGDLQVDSVGRKINNLFTSQTNCDFITYIPKYNAVWFGMGDRVFCYTERSTESGVIPAFTDLMFKQGRITSICQAEDTVYLSGYDGNLYKLDESVDTDATDLTTKVKFTSNLRTKTLNFGSDGLLKRLSFHVIPKLSGTATMNVVTDNDTSVQMKTITLPNIGTYLYDATGYLNDATDYLGADNASSWVETSRSRVRNPEMAFELVCTEGRLGVEWIKADIALVEGGD